VQRTLKVLALVAALGLVVAGCGDDSDDDGAASATTVATANPERIVSISPTATEILFAIGAGDQVVAVDDQSNYPPEAPKTQLSGFQPNLEAIVGYDPDLVVLSADTKEITDGLKAAGAEVLVQDAAKVLDDTYLQIKELGKVTGHVEEAEQLAETMEKEITSLTKSISDDVKGKTYYHELDPTYFSATSKTFIGEVYGLFGLKNIADAADNEGGGYPQLSVEYVVQQSPDYVFLADTKCCDQNAQSVASRPGWNSIAAVKNGNVVALDDDIASRWGPRVVDLIKVVAAALKKA
jgi:iron complex transport system substrate-binding protein